MSTPEAIREKKVAALESIGSSLLLVTMKVFLAVATGSLGILSEALHASLDVVSTVITYFSVRVADKPADSAHTYGHGKVENFSAFVVTGLLLLASLYIIWEAFQRLLFKEVHIEPSLLAVFILGLTIVVDVVRSRALRRVATKYQSDALEADALHFSTDVWSTVVVMFGIAVVWAGERLGVAWLRYTDPLAALVVSGIIIYVASRMGKRTVDALLDAAPAGLPQRIADSARALDGVLSADRVRVRRAGNRHFVDLTIGVPRTYSFEQVHAVSDAVERRIEELANADVTVHMEPRAATSENLFDWVRVLAQRRGLPIHEIAAHQLGGRLHVELHLEVEESLSLREAHRRATELENDIRGSVGGDGGAEPEVTIHIEPAPAGSAIPAAEAIEGLGGAVQGFLNSLRASYPELVNCHEVKVRSVDHRIIVTCHCAMDGALPIPRVHGVTQALEDRAREKFPEIERITIHPEPTEEA